MAKGLSGHWFRGDKTEKDKKETLQLLKISKPVLDKLTFLCYNTLEASESNKLNKPDYNSPSWPLVQADHNGYQRAYREIIAIIESIEE